MDRISKGNSLKVPLRGTVGGRSLKSYEIPKKKKERTIIISYFPEVV
jgi:hypothetical protein